MTSKQLLGLFSVAMWVGCSSSERLAPVQAQQAKTTSTSSKIIDDDDNPGSNVGELLYRETRFAQYFWAHSNGQINAPLAVGDPVVATVVTTGSPLPGPYAGQSINCASCHLIDEFSQAAPGTRTYADFARRSPVPDRGDGQYTTVRNTPTMVGSMRARSDQLFLHLDGQFTTAQDLVAAGLTGRNLGWLPNESATAIANVAAVIRGDDGTSPADAKHQGLSYGTILAGVDPNIPAIWQLPAGSLIDVTTATDQELFDTVVSLISQYMQVLTFNLSDIGLYIGSPYDVFLDYNGLPGKPLAGKENINQYTAALDTALNALTAPQFITADDGAFTLHGDQPFVFGSTELAGMQIFLGRGGCASCHQPPDFTDFSFHNTGAAQAEYDGMFGQGSFSALVATVPDYNTRQQSPDIFLPTTPQHPNAIGLFRSVLNPTNPVQADLGLWNVFGNPDMPASQAGLTALLCASGDPNDESCSPEALLPTTIGRFKTPGLRDLVDSGPYFHTGQKDSLEEVIQHYVDMAALAKSGNLVNGDPVLANMDVTADDIVPLAAFLRSLTVDYTP